MTSTRWADVGCAGVVNEHASCVLTLRPTKKLAKQLGMRIPPAPPVVKSRLADWCVQTFPIGQESCLIFCYTASLYPVFAKGLGVTDDETLVRRAVGMVLLVLRENGYPSQAKIIEHELTRGVQWAPIPDRSVLGSISEMIWQADHHFDDANSHSCHPFPTTGNHADVHLGHE